METSTRLKEENPHDGNGKADELNALPEYQSGDDSDSRCGSEDAQAGVKRIEAVSKAWTFTSLTIAYVTYGISPQIG
jgi:hypothetical protein